MPTLRVKFSGLCTFIFDKPLKDRDGNASDPKPTEATVLLQRLTRARLLSNTASVTSEILDQHFPLLEFSLADYDPASTRRADVHCIPDSDGKMTKGTCLLMGEDLSFLVDGQKMERHALELSNQGPQDKNASNLNKQDRDSLWWMATLGEIFRDSPEINPAILNTPPGSNQPILARVQLTEGRLRSLELTDFPCTIVPPGPAKFHQRIATTFEFTVPFSSTVAIRTVTNRNGKTTTGELMLRPLNGGDLQIEIMNMEINRLMGMDGAGGPQAEADFGVYADLLKKPIKGTVPFLRQVSVGDPSAAPHSTCSPGGGAVSG
jgi:hypothetical protein